MPQRQGETGESWEYARRNSKITRKSSPSKGERVAVRVTDDEAVACGILGTRVTPTVG